MQNTQNNKPSLIAYTVEKSSDGNGIFTSIGAAWPNKAGGFQLKLKALPVNGEIVLLPPKESD